VLVTLACGPEAMRPMFRPTPLGEVAVLVGAGDIAECGPASAAEATARLLDRIDGIVFTAGDNAYPSGRAQDFRNCYEPTWGRHKTRTRPSPGNHDYEDPGAAAYFTYFGPNAGPFGLGYYHYTAGTWSVFSLNSNVPSVQGSAQLMWLQEQLAVNAARCTVAYFHHPPFSSGMHGNHPFMHDLWRELYASRVDVVIVGHEHNYERLAPMNGEGQADPTRGVRQFIVGTGGAQLVGPGRIWPASEFRATQYGVLKLTLDVGRYQWEFLQTNGSVADSGFDVCR
jgi:hypothetical protein